MNAHQSVSVFVEINAVVNGRGYTVDYGVHGSPCWEEYDAKGIDGKTVVIAGVEVLLSDLPINLQSAILDAVYEGIDDNKWEQDDPDYD